MRRAEQECFSHTLDPLDTKPLVSCCATQVKSTTLDRVMQLHYHRIRVELIALQVAMAAPDLYSEFTLTDRYQTTVPDRVCQALGLNKRDKIRYTIQPNGQVLLSRVEPPEEDPVLEQFLSFLARDLTNNPQHIQAVNSGLVTRIQSLVAGVDLNLDAPLDREDE